MPKPFVMGIGMRKTLAWPIAYGILPDIGSVTYSLMYGPEMTPPAQRSRCDDEDVLFVNLLVIKHTPSE